MRLFQCPSCPQLVYFENSLCLRCGTALGFDPDSGSMQVIGTLQRCQSDDPTCNWLVSANDVDKRCRSCRLTVPVDDPTTSQSVMVSRLEKAKRRLLHVLFKLVLPTDQLRFAFPAHGMTGHADGLITVTQDEADDGEREKRRTELGEPYRTVIGHLRHESGHFYWDHLVKDRPWLSEVRALFGDDRHDYQAALAIHYHRKPSTDWHTHFISAYAASHPWEDWAETWAHYLHMVDALEIATAYQLSMAPVSERGRSLAPTHHAKPRTESVDGFTEMLSAWLPLTYFANSLNRSIGLQDWYPFVLADIPIQKLHLVHRIIRGSQHQTKVGGSRQRQSQGVGALWSGTAVTRLLSLQPQPLPFSPQG